MGSLLTNEHRIELESVGAARRLMKTFKSFASCIDLAKKGKTFMFVHPDFVAIDIKTWKQMRRRLSVPRTLVSYDEYDVTPEREKQIQEWFDKRLK